MSPPVSSAPQCRWASPTCTRAARTWACAAAAWCSSPASPRASWRSSPPCTALCRRPTNRPRRPSTSSTPTSTVRTERRVYPTTRELVPLSNVGGQTISWCVSLRRRGGFQRVGVLGEPGLLLLLRLLCGQRRHGDPPGAVQPWGAVRDPAEPHHLLAEPAEGAHPAPGQHRWAALFSYNTSLCRSGKNLKPKKKKCILIFLSCLLLFPICFSILQTLYIYELGATMVDYCYMNLTKMSYT